MNLFSDPHSVLGLQGERIVLLRPGAEEIFLEVLGEVVQAKKEGDFFVYTPLQKISPLDYRVFHQSGLLAHDPYAFRLEESVFLSPLYKSLGAQHRSIKGIQGILFSLWAPHADLVSLIADFNYFNGSVSPMKRVGEFWQLFVPGLEKGEKYKFEIRKGESLFIKADPFAFYSEMRPSTASVVENPFSYNWSDSDWQVRKEKKSEVYPLNVYEVHLGSWKRCEGGFLNYRHLAHDLGEYCLEMGFTHIELLPVMEHPLDESWGYQVTGFFSVTSRFGSLQDFQYFVDYLHQRGLGVILDWVPAHFPKDAFSLYQFDGTALYEDVEMGTHPHWETSHFDYRKEEVVSFLVSSALYWIDVMHVDGIRVDAVSSMLYLDYGREKGQWQPNIEGTNINLDAVQFLQRLTQSIHEAYPGALLFAEEATSYPGVTDPHSLGFDYKWNMGWMNDTLRYIQRDFQERKGFQEELTFNLFYAFSENFISVLSHDEVVHEKRSLFHKMPGKKEEKFAGVRLLYSYMMGHPGKMLTFMGNEFAQEAEWCSQSSLHWDLLQDPMHKGVQEMVKTLNHFYLQSPQLWAEDRSWDGYEWVDFSDKTNSVVAYLRKAKGFFPLLFIHHFAESLISSYHLGIPGILRADLKFNTDESHFGGEGAPLEARIEASNLILNLPPLSTQIFEVEIA